MIDTLNNRRTWHLLTICTWSPMTASQRCMSGNGYFQLSGFSHCGRHSGQAASRTSEKTGFAFWQGQKISALLQSIQTSSRARPASHSMGSWSFSQAGGPEICGESKSGVHKPRATKLCTVAPNICEHSVWNLYLVTPLVLGILRRVLNFLTPGLQPLVFRFLWHHPEVFLACFDVSKA